jgi:type II secretory pathway predicted ATPase ExeA/TPR repeat protein
MYLSYYNLSEWPFQVNSDPKFLWLGEKHKEALATLIYGVLDQRGFVLLTGDIGTGKTTLVNALLKQLDQSTEVANITDPMLDRMGFFNLLIASLGMSERFDRKEEFLLHFTRFLHQKYAEQKHVLMVVDEAHRMSSALLEQIRLLSNVELPERKLISIFLIGQNELNEKLASDKCRALRQRITLSYQVQPLSEEETGEYIRYRLKVAGTDRELFSQSALRAIQDYSGGYPRLINKICDHALLTGYVKQLLKITPSIIEECSRDLLLPGESIEASLPGPPGKPKRLPPGFSQASAKRAGQLNAGPTSGRQSEGTVPFRVFFQRIMGKGMSRGLAPAGIAAILLLLFLLSRNGLFPGLSGEAPAVRDNPPAGNEIASLGPTAATGSRPIEKTAHDQREKPPLPPGAAKHDGPSKAPAVAVYESDGGSSAGKAEVSPDAALTSALGRIEDAVKQGDFKRAVELSEEIMNKTPSPPPALKSLYVRSLIGQAKLISKTDPASAENLLIRAESTAPGDFDVLLAFGKLYTDSKKFNKAIEAYSRAADLNPRAPSLFFNLGFLYASTGDYVRAEKMFVRAIELAPPYLDKAFFNLAVVQDKQGKTEESLGNLRKALEANPANRKARELLERGTRGPS